MYDGRFSMYNTHDGGKCVWTARMRCPGGANRQGGVGESICEVSARCAEVRSGRRLAAPMYGLKKLHIGKKGRGGAW